MIYSNLNRYCWPLAILLFLPFLFNSCHMPIPALPIEQSDTLTGIPSASGLVALEDGFLVIGDDTPYLFQLDTALSLVRKIAIFPSNMAEADGSIPKPIKPDFEAMELIEGRDLLIFGSGSLSPQRNLLLRLPWPAATPVETYDLSSFYTHLRSLAAMRSQELNIEGLAYHEQRLYLLNRSNNLIFRFSYSDFVAFLQGSGGLPEVESIRARLPQLEGYPAQLTGATIAAQPPQLFFTAAVEATDNAYDDGAILGSFLGQVALGALEQAAAYQYYRLEAEETPLKVESISLIKQEKQGWHFGFVTDSDGGESLFLRGYLERK